jgi:site-specific DNA-adenine methylase
MSLRPFFSYFGSKYRASLRYPTPEHHTLIEPFAGSAGYAARYPSLRVHLCDIDPYIFGVWDYIIKTPSEEIRRLPLEVTDTDSLGIPQEAKWLIGFWLNHGCSSPRKRPSAWMRAGKHVTSFWGEAIRDRIASQADHIRHWKVTNGSFADLANQEATWFVDPPYKDVCGRLYRFDGVDYDALALWCREREGQVIVCEKEGADWLPFSPLGVFKAMGGRGKSYSEEAIWTKGGKHER